jgi:RND family efflux transporter MFP subunit
MAALLLSAGVGCSRRAAEESTSVDTSPVVEIDAVVSVERSQITESLELVGTLYPWKFAAIAPEVEGVIKKLPTHEKPLSAEVEGRKFSMPIMLDMGHEVEQGAILAELDERPFQLQLDAAQAKLDVATRRLENLLAWKRPEEIKQLEAQAEEAGAVLKRTTLELDRIEQLRRKGASSQSEYDAALAAYDTAKAAKKRADAALELAQKGPTEEEIKVAEAEVALAKADVALREDDLSKCTISCPYDAVIVDRLAGVGDRVTPQTPIMQIIDPTYLLAQVAVPEKYQHLVDVNDLATVQAPRVAEPVPGLVALVNEKIDPATRTFRARVGVENPKLSPRSESGDSGERLFKSGSYVRVTLTLRSAADALVVPSDAMTFEEGQPAVFIFQGDHVQKRPVKLGISSRTAYEVTDGLTEGEQVVVGSTSLLTDGLPVRLRERGASPAEPSPPESSTAAAASTTGDRSLSLGGPASGSAASGSAVSNRP